VGIIQKQAALRSKRLKRLQNITSTEKVLCFELWANMMDRTAKDVKKKKKICSSEEETFYLCEKVGRPVSVYGDANILTLWLTHCERVTQICVFNTVKLGTSASSP
jgi:hypothetical protein